MLLMLRTLSRHFFLFFPSFFFPSFCPGEDSCVSEFGKREKQRKMERKETIDWENVIYLVGAFLSSYSFSIPIFSPFSLSKSSSSPMPLSSLFPFRFLLSFSFFFFPSFCAEANSCVSEFGGFGGNFVKEKKEEKDGKNVMIVKTYTLDLKQHRKRMNEKRKKRRRKKL